MSDLKASNLGKTPADAVKRLRANALECLGTRIGLHLHAEANAVEALMAEADALRAEAATMREWAETAAAAENANAADLRTMRAERDRYREAARRLRAEVENYRDLLESGEVGQVDYDHLEALLAATTDDALAGPDAPPEPDAGLLAKANAALVEEVAELRAELAAERLEADGAINEWWSPGISTEARDNGWLWVRRDPGLTLAVTLDRVEVRDRRGVVASFRRDDQSARAAMRAAEAEARRLGLLS